MVSLNGKENISPTPAFSEQLVLGTEKLALLSGTANPKLAKSVAEILSVQLSEPVWYFANREACAQVNPMAGKNVFILQSTYSDPGDVATILQDVFMNPEVKDQANETLSSLLFNNFPRSVNDRLLELFVMIDAARRSSARKIISINPFFGYERQERKAMPGVPISGAMVARILESLGISHLLSFDLHAEALMGVVDIPWDNFYASKALIPVVQPVVDPEKTYFISPDRGGVPRAEAWASRFGIGLERVGYVIKSRDHRTGKTKSRNLSLNIGIKHPKFLIIDDLIGSVNTINGAADLCNGEIYAVATHGVFTRNPVDPEDDALHNIDNSSVSKFFITDTIDQPSDIVNHPKIDITSVAPMIAEGIIRIHQGIPMGDLID